MAILKQRLHKKNLDGTYDTVYLETNSDTVLMSDGTTLTVKINNLITTINGKANSSHTHSQYAASSHTHAASAITAGTLAGNVVAKSAGAIGTKMIRNIYAGTSDIGVGATLTTGDIYFVYE